MLTISQLLHCLVDFVKCPALHHNPCAIISSVCLGCIVIDVPSVAVALLLVLPVLKAAVTSLSIKLLKPAELSYAVSSANQHALGPH